jgi:hypothetical protein
MPNESSREAAHLAVLLTWVIIAVFVGLALRWRSLVRLYRFAEEGQYAIASQKKIDLFLEDARKSGWETQALQELADLRRLHGRDLKEGHLVWATAKLMGTLPAGVQSPAFVPGDGIREAQERLGPVFPYRAIR